MQRQAPAEPQVAGPVDYAALHHVNAIRGQHALQGEMVPALAAQREVFDREVSAQSRARNLPGPPVQAALVRVPTVRSGRRQRRDDSQRGQDALERLLGVNLDLNQQASSASHRETAVAAGPYVGRREREPVYRDAPRRAAEVQRRVPADWQRGWLLGRHDLQAQVRQQVAHRCSGQVEFGVDRTAPGWRGRSRRIHYVCERDAADTAVGREPRLGPRGIDRRLRLQAAAERRAREICQFDGSLIPGVPAGDRQIQFESRRADRRGGESS